MTPARILIVEDNRVVARDIRQQLKRIGHKVIGMAVRGEDAILMAVETRPDLVLMDIRLEGSMDGVDAAQEIRLRCHSPVVFLTAYSDDETVRRASETEPFGFLLKPFEDSQLRTVIEMALYKHGAERRLRESERRYATTLASIGDAVIATDKDGAVTFLNPVAIALTGWSPEEAIGQPVSKVFHIINEDTREIVEDPAGKALRLGITVGLANHTLLISRDGQEFPIDDCGSPIIDDSGETTGAVLVFRDMTRRYRADEALRESQEALARIARLTTMGELTISIAHEVNQPLMSIVTNAAACVQWLSESHLNIEEARNAAERVVEDGHRAGNFVASIRALARKSPPQLAELDLNGAITEVLMLTRGELRRQAIAVESDLNIDAAAAFGDRVQIQQVVLNLIMNSIEAMSLSDSGPRLLQIKSRRDESKSIFVTISDTGPGIQEVNMERIFDPFFTTKPGGIGMGLSICRSIIEAHGGRLWASSRQPRGTDFCFTVPNVSLKRFYATAN